MKSSMDCLSDCCFLVTLIHTGCLCWFAIAVAVANQGRPTMFDCRLLSCDTDPTLVVFLIHYRRCGNESRETTSVHFTMYSLGILEWNASSRAKLFHLFVQKIHRLSRAQAGCRGWWISVCLDGFIHSNIRPVRGPFIVQNWGHKHIPLQLRTLHLTHKQDYFGVWVTNATKPLSFALTKESYFHQIQR